MIVRTFIEPHLRHRSYLLAASGGNALVVDPNRWVDQYLSQAAQDHVTITTVIDTHVHSDYVSGAPLLARRTNAVLAISGCGDRDRRPHFTSGTNVHWVSPGDVLRVDDLCLTARHAPGHSTEHLSFVVSGPDGNILGAFTGDSNGDPPLSTAPMWPTHDAGAPDLLCDRPRYFSEVERINRGGGRARRRRHHWETVVVDDLAALIASCAVFVDIRPNAITTGYLPGSLLVPLGDSFVLRAGSLLRYGMPVRIVCDSPEQVDEVGSYLSLIGLDDISGWIPAPVLTSYEARGGTLERLRTATPRDAIDWLADGALLLDVRSTAEWNQRHMRHAVHTPLPHILDDVRDVDRDTPVVVYSQEESPSVVAVTALRRAGFSTVLQLVGAVPS
jgi:glyoxylase-like metal-dependent hydrolase (beta-lactamase superfamily II)/rhodanese-related sulfurtransferase